MKTFYILILATALFAKIAFSEEATTPTPPTDDEENTDPTISCSQKLIEEENKKVIRNFIIDVFEEKNATAIDKYVVAEGYIQHNPFIADGREALKTAAEGWFEGAAKEKIDVRAIGADGDLVWIHLKALRAGKLHSIFELFRMKNGQAAEHWDVAQEVTKSTANEHPWF